MKKLAITALGLTLIMGMACKDTKKKEMDTDNGEELETVVQQATDTTMADNGDKKTITVQLDAKSNSQVSGTVTFTETSEGVTMMADINGLKPGKHGIHIHENGDCSAPDGKSAGGHWNPTNQPHGKWGSEAGYHKGDIGNITADADGHATMTFTTNEWCIGCSDETKNIVDKGMVIHGGEDDLTSQPSGDAGARVACGVIMQ